MVGWCLCSHSNLGAAAQGSPLSLINTHSRPSILFHEHKPAFSTYYVSQTSQEVMHLLGYGVTHLKIIFKLFLLESYFKTVTSGILASWCSYVTLLL